MRRFPNIRLPLALAVLITSRYVIGLTTRSQLRQLITMILNEDELYKDVLSEKVILNNLPDTLPPWIETIVNELDNVDPLKALLALRTSHEHYSGYNLNVSAIILGKSLSCLMHKHVAFHLSMIIGIIQNKDNWVKFKARTTIFVYVIPFYIDMLYSIYKKYDDLLRVYDFMNGMVSTLDTAEGADYEAHIQKMKEELKILIDVIKSSCVVNEMKQYCMSFQLEHLKSCDTINEENIVTNLDNKTAIHILIENEEVILNLYDEIDLLRSMQMDAWKVWLNIPNLPRGELVRTPPPRRKYEFTKMISNGHLAVKKDEMTEIPVEGQSIDSKQGILDTETPNAQT